MIKKCSGCGAYLQTKNPEKEGYIKSDNYETDTICERCFRIKHYNEYKTIVKNNNDFINILKNINQTKDLVVLVVDVFNINKNINLIKQYIDNDVLLVLTKRDVLPKSLNDDKLLSYVDNLNIKYIDKIIISSNKNYQFDLLMDKINKYKKTNKVYVVGFTNAGKSSMINKIIYNYSDIKDEITTSMLPSTTIDNIEIKINDSLTIIDTPGILDEGSIINYIDFNTLKKITPNKEIKPKVFQVKVPQSIIVSKILRVDCLPKTELIFYFSNNLIFERIYKNIDKPAELKEHDFMVDSNHDIVISGLGFIKVNKKTRIKIYMIKNVDVYVRTSLI